MRLMAAASTLKPYTISCFRCVQTGICCWKVLLVSIVRLEGIHILELTYTHVGIPLHRGQMATVGSHKGETLASGLAINSWLVPEEKEGDFPTNRSLSTPDVIAGSHFQALGISDISQRQLRQQGKYSGLHSGNSIPWKLDTSV